MLGEQMTHSFLFALSEMVLCSKVIFYIYQLTPTSPWKMTLNYCPFTLELEKGQRETESQAYPKVEKN